MVLDVLEDLGFSAAEAKTYFVLLKLGSSVKVGKIIEKSGLQSSTIHNILNGLIERGFVTYVLKGNVRHYQAISPELLLESYRQKKRNLKKCCLN